MAKSKSLPAYKEAQRLVSTLHETTKKAPKELRYTLVQRLLSESVELIVDIDTANRLQGHARGNQITKAQRRNARLDVFKEGNAQSLDQFRYWSTTDPNEGGRAWDQAFTLSGVEGIQRALPKDLPSKSVRPVRRVVL